MKPWVFFLRHFCAICLPLLFWSPSALWASRYSSQELCYTNDRFHTSQCGHKNALFSFFFPPSKRLLSGATCDWCKWLPLCFDVLGWTLLSPMFFYLSLTVSTHYFNGDRSAWAHPSQQQPGGAGGTRVGVGECLLIESERHAGEVTRRVTWHTGKASQLMMMFATADIPRDFLQ